VSREGKTQLTKLWSVDKKDKVKNPRDTVENKTRGWKKNIFKTLRKKLRGKKKFSCIRH